MRQLAIFLSFAASRVAAARPGRRPASVLGMFVVGLFALAMATTPAAATTIDVSLNVLYDDPMDPLSGGNWSLSVKTGGAGLNHLNLKLTGIATAVPVAPVGTVNGHDEAGFGVFGDNHFPAYRNITIGQGPLASVGPGEEQSVFYGVGTLMNGMPGQIGPVFTSLANVSGVPWANMQDVLGTPGNMTEPWDFTATLLTGTFNDGSTPAFYSSLNQTGSVYTAVGNSQEYGDLLPLSLLSSTIVRTNLILPSDADYNNDGTVNAADYTVWRNAIATQDLRADGTGTTGFPDGVVDQLDYQFWKDHYGETVPIGPGSGATTGNSTVPEPSTAILLLFGGIHLVGRVRRGQRATREAIA